MAMSEEQMAGAVHAKAVVNSMGDGIANVSHDPIPEIGWPAMDYGSDRSRGVQK